MSDPGLSLVLELKMWKMSQFMTLTDGDKSVIERNGFLMNDVMIHSVRLSDTELNLPLLCQSTCE